MVAHDHDRPEELLSIAIKRVDIDLESSDSFYSEMMYNVFSFVYHGNSDAHHSLLYFF